MSENQNWQEQLQQRAGDLIARRLGNFAEELQTIQTALNGIQERLHTNLSPISAEESSELHECLEQARYSAIQDVENDFQARLEEVKQQVQEQTAAQVRQEYEARLQELQVQLDEARQSAGNLGLAAAGVAGVAVGAGVTAPAYSTLRTAIEEIDSQRQQADVLSALVSHASEHATRTVFFVTKSGQAVGWKATGFTQGLTDDNARSLNIPLQPGSLLGDAVSSLSTTVIENATPGLLGHYDSQVAKAIAVPLVIRGKAAAILYAETANDERAINQDAIESLMHVTAMAIELLPARRNQPATAAPAPAAKPAAQPTPQPAPTSVAEVTPEPAPQPQPAVAEQPQPEVVPSVVVSPVSAVAEVQETVQAEAAISAPPSAASPTSGQSDDEVRAHNDARRFARLLVSEIKLYNEQKVMEGRRAHDLYERLKEDIDRSRQMYEKRVSAPVAAKFDYFYDELLHTLGEGDPAKLGSGCPGPTVPIN